MDELELEAVEVVVEAAVDEVQAVVDVEKAVLDMVKAVVDVVKAVVDVEQMEEAADEDVVVVEEPLVGEDAAVAENLTSTKLHGGSVSFDGYTEV